MHGERLYSLAGLCRGGRIAPQAIPALRGYAGKARACGAYRYPLPMAAERSGEAYGANRIISRTSQGDIPGRGSVKGACRRKSLQKAPYPAMIKGRSI